MPIFKVKAKLILDIELEVSAESQAEANEIANFASYSDWIEQYNRTIKNLPEGTIEIEDDYT